MAELHRRTEGWPVGLYLAALYLGRAARSAGAAASFGGDDRFVSEYVESELLARISRPQRVFLTRTAVLERMCGPLCEAVLDLPGSGATPGRAGPVEPAAGAAGPAGAVVPLPPPVPRHAAGGAGTRGTRPDPGPAAPRRRLVPAQRPARGGAGVLHGRRGRRGGRPPGGETLAAGLPARPGHDPAAVVPVAGATGAGSRDTRCSPSWPRSCAPGRAAGRGRAVGRRGRSLAIRTRPRPDDPVAEAWAAVLRARCAGMGSSRCAPTPTRPRAGSRRQASCGAGASSGQGIARVLCGDLDGGDAFLADAISLGGSRRTR